MGKQIYLSVLQVSESDTLLAYVHRYVHKLLINTSSLFKQILESILKKTTQNLLH